MFPAGAAAAGVHVRAAGDGAVHGLHAGPLVAHDQPDPAEVQRDGVREAEAQALHLHRDRAGVRGERQGGEGGHATTDGAPHRQRGGEKTRGIDSPFCSQNVVSAAWYIRCFGCCPLLESTGEIIRDTFESEFTIVIFIHYKP